MKSWEKRLTALLGASMVLSIMCGSAFATDSSSATTTSATVISAFSTGFQSIVSDAMSMIGTAVPIALTLAGVLFLVRKAMSWFRSMAK